MLMILSGNRVNALSHMKVTNMYLTDTECTFITFDETLKHSRPGFNDKPMVFRSFQQDTSLCPVATIKKYLDIRLQRSSEAQLFITTVQPYKGASCDTISRWIKNTMAVGGIDTGHFTPHSCRSASTTAAAMRGISIKTIIKSA